MVVSILPPGKKLILASRSPRRQQLLSDMGLRFEVRVENVEEVYPPELQASAIAEYLASLKADAISGLAENEIVLTSDTVVWCKGRSLAKARDEEEAYKMLRLLSGTHHQVITGVCLRSVSRKEIFSDTVKVFFRELSDEEIYYYIRNFKPFDKAGAYGIQEWIGMVAITAIEGSFFTVMGLPTHLVVERLRSF